MCFFVGRRGRVGLQAHLDLAQAQNLAGLDDALGDLLAVDEGAVGGVQVPHHHVVPAQQNLAVMAGDGGLGNLEGVVLDPADGGLLRLQLVGASGHSRAEDNKFRHKSVKWCDYHRRPIQVKRKRNVSAVKRKT